MIAPHHEDDEDSVVNLPLLVELVAGQTPEIIEGVTEINNTTAKTTSEFELSSSTTETSTTIEPTTMDTTTKKPFLSISVG